MNTIPTTVSVTLATLCALAMGFAIRRGATCTVAAVNQVVAERRFSRLLAMPLLRPYAWVAFAAMCVAIGAAGAAARMLGMWRQRVLGEQA